jgi:hypothetical protein
MRATLMTPRSPGAIAIIQIDGDVDAALKQLNIGPLSVGQRKLCDLCGIDRGMAVRWSRSCAQLMPHGGPAVVDGLLAACRSRGIPVGDEAPWPEADDDLEAAALGAIARAPSPAAVSRLLAQPRLWRAWDGITPSPDRVDAHSAILNRLLDPPIVVAVGRPNIGKSALCNALAGRHVALVADEPGVTRDHVGVSIRLGVGGEAVEVRWIDTPGIGADAPNDELERAAVDSAFGVIRDSDCVILCGDRDSGFVDPSGLPIRVGAPIIRLALRCDLGRAPGAEVFTSAVTGEGLSAFSERLKSAMFPSDSMSWPGPWRFDASLSPPPTTGR